MIKAQEQLKSQKKDNLVLQYLDERIKKLEGKAQEMQKFIDKYKLLNECDGK